MKTKISVSLLLLISLFCSCSEKDNPSEPLSTEESQKEYLQIVEPLEDNYDLLINLLTELDTTAAMDSVLKIILQDTLVSWGEAGEQGIAIQYKSGIRGGIFLDPLDSPDSNDNFLSNYELSKYYDIKNTNEIKPASRKTIFLNPSYHERTYWADLIIQNYNDRLPAAGYEKPVVYKNNEATIEKFMNLSGYGIVHIYSHGWAWPNRNNIKEVFLLTGEPWSVETYLKYYEEIQSGDIPIVKTLRNRFFISPSFIANHNNFIADTTLIYGGFCYSYLGNWPGIMVNTLNAGGYYGFDWAVWTSKNAKWNLDLMMDISDTSQHPAITSSKWMNNQLPKWYWSHRFNRAVNIKYLGHPDLTLVEDEDSPNFKRCLISLSIKMDIQLSSGEVNNGVVRYLTPEGDVTRIEEGLENDIYYMDWDEDRGGYNHKGGIELTISRSTMQIISYKIWSEEYMSTGRENYTFEGTQLNTPIQYGEYLNNYSSLTSDSEVCTSLTQLSYSFDFNNEWPDLNTINYYCDETSYLSISFTVED